jgi:hypothetical protein
LFWTAKAAKLSYTSAPGSSLRAKNCADDEEDGVSDVGASGNADMKSLQRGADAERDENEADEIP